VTHFPNFQIFRTLETSVFVWDCEWLKNKETRDKRPESTLQHTATHCNTLQHTATHCNTVCLRLWVIKEQRDKRQETKDRRQEARETREKREKRQRDARQETRDEETSVFVWDCEWLKNKETRDKRQKTGDKRQERRERRERRDKNFKHVIPYRTQKSSSLITLISENFRDIWVPEYLNCRKINLDSRISENENSRLILVCDISRYIAIYLDIFWNSILPTTISLHVICGFQNIWIWIWFQNFWTWEWVNMQADFSWRSAISTMSPAEEVGWKGLGLRVEF